MPWFRFLGRTCITTGFTTMAVGMTAPQAICHGDNDNFCRDTASLVVGLSFIAGFTIFLLGAYFLHVSDHVPPDHLLQEDLEAQPIVPIMPVEQREKEEVAEEQVAIVVPPAVPVRATAPRHVLTDDENAFLQLAYQNEQIPQDFLCPISREVMCDPVVTDAGYTYDRSSIQGFFNKGGLCEPTTGIRLPSADLRPNWLLRGSIIEWLEKGARNFRATHATVPESAIPSASH